VHTPATAFWRFFFARSKKTMQNCIDIRHAEAHNSPMPQTKRRDGKD